MPRYLGVSIPARIAGLPGPLVVGGGAIAVYLAATGQLTRVAYNVGQGSTRGHWPAHRPAGVVARTGLVMQDTAPNRPPAGAQGTGEWVVVNCPGHGGTGVCWEWQPLTEITLQGVPIS